MTDLRFACRQLRKRPGPSLAAALALALGVGLPTLQFSMVNCLLLRPLPFEDSHRLRLLERLDPKTQRRLPFSLLEWPSLQAATRSFEGLAAYSEYDHFELSAPGLPAQRYFASLATANLIEVLRVRPLLGRWFVSEEDQRGSSRVVVLSHHAWQHYFGGEPNGIGRSERNEESQGECRGSARGARRDAPVRFLAWRAGLEVVLGSRTTEGACVSRGLFPWVRSRRVLAPDAGTG